MPSPGALTAPPIRLLTLEHAGRTWRVSSRVCDVPDAVAWRTHHYRGGLAAEDAYLEAPFLEVADASTVPVEVLVDADLAALLADGHLLAELRGELALYREGDDYAARLVLVRGRAEVESGGYLGRPLRLSLVGDSPVSTPGTWPPPEQTISDETWSSLLPTRTHDEAEEGSVYPQAIGHVGIVSGTGSDAFVPASPVLPVVLDGGGANLGLIRYSPWGDVNQWAPWPPLGRGFGLVSAGYIYPGSMGSTGQGEIWVTRDESLPSPRWKRSYLYYATDALGQVVTLCQLQVVLPALTAWGDIVSGHSYYTAIAAPCSGIARPDYRGGLTGAGEIVRWALTQSAIRVDWRRTVPALARLDRYRIAGFWDQSCDAWGWVSDNILPLIPATWIPGPDGMYPVVWRIDATAENADLHLTDGLNCTIEGEPKLETGDIRSRLILDYAHALTTSTYQRRATIHGAPPRAGQRDALTPYLRRAQQRYGSARGGQALTLDETSTTDVVYDDSTAWLIQAWRSRVYSGARTRYRVVAPHHSRLAAAEPGMVVALTSSRYSLTSRVCHVVRAGWLGGLCYADIVALEP